MHSSPAATILIIDDEHAHQYILAQMLGGEGYAVLVASDIAEALAIARATPPELIILDQGLPRQGPHQLRAAPALRAVPIIFTRASHDGVSRSAAFAEGAVDYLEKPFHTAEVVARVRTQVALRRLQLRLDERTTTLQLSNERHARALAAREARLTGVSHELRAPLNAILGLTDLLREGVYGALTAGQQQAVETIAASGQHLLSLLNDILDLARLEDGQEEPALALVAPAEIATAALDLARPGAQHANVHLTVNLSPCLPRICADQRRVTQILLNLLANALRFTPAGGRVGLDLAAAPGGAAVRFTVWDTGPGIAPAQMGRLFQAFSQLEGASQAGGTGLGLALVAHLARLHGGSAALDSVVGAGSRFSVTLPLEPPPAGEAPDCGPSPRAPVALIIDEHRPTAVNLAAWLRRAGYACAVAPDIAGASELFTARRPDLAAVALPARDHQGEATLPRLRAGPLAATPIIAIGTVILPDSASRARRAGADTYLARPLTPAGVARAIARVR